jgi:hypothetical protein
MVEFVKYKFINSMFTGLSIGAIFTIYKPLSPIVFSIGGIVLAIFMMFIAKIYYKILNINSFFYISIFVEVVLLFTILIFIVFKITYINAIFIYCGYQLTFLFGSYLLRAETLFLRKSKLLSIVDISKQKGYLVGLVLSYVIYFVFDKYTHLDKLEQTINIHFAFLIVQFFVLYFLIKSFKAYQ